MTLSSFIFQEKTYPKVVIPTITCFFEIIYLKKICDPKLRPDMAGPHVQLQTGSLSGGNIPQGILWPRRWWREALRRRNAIQECRSLNGPDSISKVNQILTLTLADFKITDAGGCSL